MGIIKRGRKRTETYYTRKIIYFDNAIEHEEQWFIRLIFIFLKKYYTRIWEHFYDKEV